MISAYKQDLPHIMVKTLLTVFALSSNAAFSQSLDDAVNTQLAIAPAGLGCDVLFAGGGNPTGALLDICNRPVAQGYSPGATGGASATPPSSPSSKKPLEETNNEIQLSSNWSVFFTVEAGSLDRERTELEGPFTSTVNRFLGGASYTLNKDLSISGILNISTQDGDFSNGGSFNTDATELNVLASYQVNDKLSAQASVFLQNISTDRERIASFSDVSGTQIFNQVFGSPTASFSPKKTGFSTNVDYQFNFGKYTLMPQAGIEWSKTDFGTYSENDDSGLQLTFHDDQVESFQSKIGVIASTVVNTGSGVFLPQISLDWRHEFEDEGRNIIVSFVEDLNSTKFSYETSDQDSDYIDLNVGGVFVFPNGYQGFVNVQKYLSHSLYDTMLVSAGVRKEL